ncbi:FHA domain-containing protein [Streptomyces prasinopilosus]|uniref:FtsK/SpoIIIE family protein n=3 Tax=Streptomyces prasinopilosus TaxID=67344 RepID=A0A1G6I1A1_9ACTN|nr:FHA domain-containing protein [Streptomyces prasinopilosus]SDC00312.1 FtsK/SpoIIIE family protein [Streptomyces prasinopilosus]
MQIRLTVVDPLGLPSPARGHVVVTAPAGTALAAVAAALVSAVSGGDGSSGSAGSSGIPVLYAGDQRLDAQRCTLGEPPLIDGAVLAVGAPGEPEPHPELDDAPTRLHVVAGPDAGGVHLLHGGEIRIGRSADADVPLDDPDVSRLHCAVTVGPDGRVSVADLGSTNGTTLDGRRVGSRPVGLSPGALLRIGESALRLTPAAGPGARARTTPDGEGHVRVPEPPAEAFAEPPAGAAAGAGPAAVRPPDGPTHHGYGSPGPRTVGEAPLVPGQGGAPGIEDHGTGSAPGTGSGTDAGPGFGSDTGTGSDSGSAGRDGGDDRSGRTVPPASRGEAPRVPGGRRVTQPGPADGGSGPASGARAGAPIGSGTGDGFASRPVSPGSRPAGGHEDTPAHGTGPVDAGLAPRPSGGRRRGGLSAWARRLTGGRPEPEESAGPEAYRGTEAAGAAPAEPVLAPPGPPETWPDPATLLLTALGPGPRLWERGPGHPEALAVRLGTADRAVPGGSGLLPAVPVTSGLREVGSLGLAGPRERLSGLARAVLAQLAALHSPDTLEIVLITADPSRGLEERTAEWAWLGWLPHVRPGRGQDCRLLLAHDREQAAARAGELLRRLDDHDHAARTSPAPAPLPAPSAPLIPEQPRASGVDRGAPRRPARDAGEGPAGGFPGPYTVVVVDGDPGDPGVREALARLAVEGPRAGVHLVCLAETAAASASSPVTETYRAACAVTPAFRECGAVALLSGDVATTLRLLRVAATGSGAAPGPVGHGTVATVDAVSPAWAERFARALAPLRTAGVPGTRHARVSAPLPPAARLLDELGLARATPASLMARWADAADDKERLGGRVCAVLGAGPRGPVSADLVADGPHLLVEGPPGSGRTELLRAVVASLAAAERPDRLGIVLVDGRAGTTGGGTGDGPGDGLRVCTDVPHVTTHLSANDPVRMREFAQSLSAELKRRAELLGRSDFMEWHTGRELSDRMVAQRTAAPRGSAAGAGEHSGGEHSGGDLEAPPSSTLRLRPGAARLRAQAPPPLPRLVVVVDDLDALVSPALGSPGRPAAGSVLRALDAVAREGERLGVHLVSATGPCARTAESEPVRRAALRVTLDPPAPGREIAPSFDPNRESGGEPAPGRGRLAHADGRVTAFQGGRVTGRIPRTATLRPTVVPLEWHRMGDPPARRPVRELGNGPTDLALLASALERAGREVSATGVPSLL